MSEPVFREYEFVVTFVVWSSGVDEALAAVERSGLTPGGLIGEALVMDVVSRN